MDLADDGTVSSKTILDAKKQAARRVAELEQEIARLNANTSAAIKKIGNDATAETPAQPAKRPREAPVDYDDSDDDEAPLVNEEDDAQEGDVTMASKAITAKGLRPAAYYKKIAETEGELRRRLRYIHMNVMARSLVPRDGTMCETLLPADTVDVKEIREALLTQDFRISDTVIPARCVCGTKSVCMLEGKCKPAYKKISWS